MPPECTNPADPKVGGGVAGRDLSGSAEVFIVPVALDEIDDLRSVLPVRIRAASMIRAYHLGFDDSLAEPANAILDVKPTRVVESDKPGLYVMLWDFTEQPDKIAVAIGSRPAGRDRDRVALARTHDR